MIEIVKRLHTLSNKKRVFGGSRDTRVLETVITAITLLLPFPPNLSAFEDEVPWLCLHTFNSNLKRRVLWIRVLLSCLQFEVKAVIETWMTTKSRLPMSCHLQLNQITFLITVNWNPWVHLLSLAYHRFGNGQTSVCVFFCQSFTPQAQRQTSRQALFSVCCWHGPASTTDENHSPQNKPHWLRHFNQSSQNADLHFNQSIIPTTVQHNTQIYKFRHWQINSLSNRK